MFQSIQQVQTPCAENVVREDEVFLWEDPEVLEIIFLPHDSVSAHQLHVLWWEKAVCCPNP